MSGIIRYIRVCIVCFGCTMLFLFSQSINVFAVTLHEDSHTTYVIITVDAETPSVNSLGSFPFPEQLNAKILQEKVGITRMMDIADKFNVPVTFFVNIYEYPRFGKDAMKNIVRTIDQRGHDVQLHTHPELIDLKRRVYMYEYSLLEQIEIIREGKELIKEWTGNYPVAHRTGTYAANEDTMEALRQNEIFFDSTWFYSNSYARRLERLGFSNNAVSFWKDIVELPVTIFQIGEWESILSYRLPALYRYKKVDVDSCTLPQLLDVIEQSEENDLDVVIIFMHSWSFVKRWHEDLGKREADLTDINDFTQLLSFIASNNNIKVVSAKQFTELFFDKKIELTYKDFVPLHMEKIGKIHYIRKTLGITRQNYKLILIVLGVFSIVFFYCFLKYLKNVSMLKK